MVARIIFCATVSLAILAVILLALLSPHSNPSSKDHSRPGLALSLYIQHAQMATNSQPVIPRQDHIRAFVFHRMLTEGPENTSRVVGNAQGFIVPTEHFANSPFNIIYLTFDAPGYSGSISIQAKRISHEDDQRELIVVGGTGSYAFARGFAVFAQPLDTGVPYHVKLHLNFPQPPRTRSR